ncbi:MAG: hypothetical protein ABJ360_04975 [Roseobacter sp.]
MKHFLETAPNAAMDGLSTGAPGSLRQSFATSEETIQAFHGHQLDGTVITAVENPTEIVRLLKTLEKYAVADIRDSLDRALIAAVVSSITESQYTVGIAFDGAIRDVDEIRFRTSPVVACTGIRL